MFLHRDRDFSKATVDARAFVDQFAQKALDYGAAHSSEKGTSDDPGNRYVFLYELAKQTSDKKMLTDQLLNILLAGRDTTASLLSITCFILARRPEIWDKLREEVLRLEPAPGELEMAVQGKRQRTETTKGKDTNWHWASVGLGKGKF